MLPHKFFSEKMNQETIFIAQKNAENFFRKSWINKRHKIYLTKEFMNKINFKFNKNKIYKKKQKLKKKIHKKKS